MNSNPKTLFEKVWERHVVHSIENGLDVLYIDKHLIHEVTSPVDLMDLKGGALK
jgi:3-isopropylmalate/(R)-2-methylmalate dehydratase large subunit